MGVTGKLLNIGTILGLLGSLCKIIRNFGAKVSLKTEECSEAAGQSPACQTAAGGGGICFLQPASKMLAAIVPLMFSTKITTSAAGSPENGLLFLGNALMAKDIRLSVQCMSQTFSQTPETPNCV